LTGAIAPGGRQQARIQPRRGNCSSPLRFFLIWGRWRKAWFPWLARGDTARPTPGRTPCWSVRRCWSSWYPLPARCSDGLKPVMWTITRREARPLQCSRHHLQFHGGRRPSHGL